MNSNCSGLSDNAIVVVALRAPEVPVIVTMAGAKAGADPLTVSARKLVVAVGLLIHEAVTPAGRTEVTARFTLPVNPA